MILRFANFTGMIPQLAPTQLPDNAAQNAVNCLFRNRGIAAWRNMEPLLTLFPTNTTSKTAVLVHEDGFADLWVVLADANNVLIKHPVFTDAFNRVYYTNGAGSGNFQYNSRSALTLNADTGFQVGMPVPDTTPTVAVAGGAGPTETRYYCYTWVSQWGEESPPSPISVATTGNTTGGAVWNVTLPAPTKPAGYNLFTGLSYRLYRTNSGTSSATFRLVAEVTEALLITLGRVIGDNLTNDIVARNVALPSKNWARPFGTGIADALGSMGNGIMVYARGRRLRFSEPYLPHTYPAEYERTLPYNILGFGQYGNTLIVPTTGRAYVVAGNHPAVITTQEIDYSPPCLAGTAIVGSPDGVLYPSKDGLFMVTPGGAVNVTKGLLTREEWETLIGSDLVARWWRDRYIALLPSTARGFVLDFSLEPVSFSLLDFSILGDTFLNMFVDPVDNGFHIIVGTPSGPRQVFLFDSPNKASVDYQWDSKSVLLPKPVNFGAIKITFDDVSSVAAKRSAVDGNHAVTIKLYVNNVQRVFHTETYTPGSTDRIRYRRLPAGYKGERVQIKITGNANLVAVDLAETMRELKQL